MRHCMGVLLGATLVFAGCDVGDDRTSETGAADDTAAAVDTMAAPAPGDLISINQSGVRGSATLDIDDSSAVVEVAVTGLEPGTAYPAHVHEGDCVAGGPIRLPLGRLTADEEGAGSVRMRVGHGRLPADAPLFVQVHDPDGRPVACANVADGNGDENGEQPGG